MNAKDVSKSAFALALLLFLPLPLLAQTNPVTQSRAVGPQAVTSTDRPEVITIIAEKSIHALQLQVWSLEDHMFGLFNQLNDDHRYDVHCEKETKTGSLIGKRACNTNFMRDSMSKNSQASLADMRGEGAVRVAPSQSELNFRYPLFKEKIRQLAEKNPDLAQAIADYSLLKEELGRRLSNASGKE